LTSEGGSDRLEIGPLDSATYRRFQAKRPGKPGQNNRKTKPKQNGDYMQIDIRTRNAAALKECKDFVETLIPSQTAAVLSAAALKAREAGWSDIKFNAAALKFSF
jgi:hypothetical protein